MSKKKNLNPTAKTKHYRKDYIELDYLDGAFDKDGKQVIRALNREEQDWLKRFYEEEVNANFQYSTELKNLNKKKDKLIKDDFELKDITKNIKIYETLVKTLTKKLSDYEKQYSADDVQYSDVIVKNITNMRKDLRSAKTKLRDLTKTDRPNRRKEIKASKAYKEIESAIDDLCLNKTVEERQKVFNENYTRESCIYNHTKKQGLLVKLDPSEYDKYYLDQNLCSDSFTKYDEEIVQECFDLLDEDELNVLLEDFEEFEDS